LSGRIGRNQFEAVGFELLAKRLELAATGWILMACAAGSLGFLSKLRLGLGRLRNQNHHRAGNASSNQSNLM
jgi:hypothetical protein